MEEIKELDFAKGFYINQTGEVWHPVLGRREIYLNGDGYRTVSIRLNSGLWQTFGLHRLLGMAFIPNETGEPYEKLTINHKDLNIENNDLNNLEWCSVSENNIHASLMSEKHHGGRKRLIGTFDGKNYLFENIPQASCALEIKADLIWQSIKSKSPIHGWVFEHIPTKGFSLPNDVKRSTGMNSGHSGLGMRPVKIKNINTDEVLCFDSILQAADFFNTNTSHIFQCITGTKIRLFKQNYLIVDKDEDFPIVTNETLADLRSSVGKEVLVYDHEENKLLNFKSASLFIKRTGLSKKSVTVILKKKTLRRIEKYTFTYTENSENVKKITDLVNVHK